MQLMRSSGPMITGVVEALRLLGDKVMKGEMDYIMPLDLFPIMQVAEGVERNIHDAYTQLNYTSPNPVDYIGETINEEGMAGGIIKWVVTDYDREDNKCEIEKVAQSPGHKDEVIGREWMSFREVRAYLAAWQYPLEAQGS